MTPGLVMYDDDVRQISAICERLTREASAKAVFLVDKNGQLLLSSGQADDVDTTSLASLAAGNVAAMGGLAKLIGENEFPTQFHEGERESLHMSIVAGRVVLVVVFDARSSLGLVRLRVRRATEDLTPVVEAIAGRPAAASPLAEITEEDIDQLFGGRS